MKLINFNGFFIILIVIYLNTTTVKAGDEKDDLAKRKLITSILINMQNCTEETGAQVDLFQLFDPKHETAEKKLFVKCMMTKLGWLDGNNKLSIDGLKAMAKDITDGNTEVIMAMEGIGKKCLAITDSIEIENIFKYYQCILQEVETRNINFGF